MGTAQHLEENLAPLAFQMSIRSERIELDLKQNYIDTMTLIWNPLLAACLAVGVSGGMLALFSVPMWLSFPLAMVPGYFVYKATKRHYANDYVDARIAANCKLMLASFEQEDASALARIVESIVSSHFGKEKWARDLNAKRAQGICDDHYYIGGIHAFAPACWRLCAAKVYDLHTLAASVRKGATRG